MTLLLLSCASSTDPARAAEGHDTGAVASPLVVEGGQEAAVRLEPKRADAWTLSAGTDGLELSLDTGDPTAVFSAAGLGIGVVPDVNAVGDGNLQVWGRLGVQTGYWMEKPYSEGAALSIGTGDDLFGFYVENESVDGHDAISTYSAAVTPRTAPYTNIAAWTTAANASAGNVGLRVDAQYSPDASPPNQTLHLREVSGNDVLYQAYINPTYFDFRDGTYAIPGVEFRINGVTVATISSSGMSAQRVMVGGGDRAVEPAAVGDEALSRLERAEVMRDSDGRLVLGDGEVDLEEQLAWLVAANRQMLEDNARLQAEVEELRGRMGR